MKHLKTKKFTLNKKNGIFFSIIGFIGMIITYSFEGIIGYVFPVISMYILLIGIIIIVLSTSIQSRLLKNSIIVIMIVFFSVLGCLFLSNLLSYVSMDDEEYIIELNDAISADNKKNVKKLLKQGREINISRGDYTPLWYPIEDYKDWFSPLQIACDSGHYEIVKLLVEHGSDVNFQDVSRHSSPLLLAVQSENEDNKYEVVKYLLDNGAKKELVDIYGKKAFDYAVENNDVKIIKLLQ